jgi:hypothetical protein
MSMLQPKYSSTERGNALLYVLLAVGLLAALTYFYAQDSRENYSSQAAISISESLFAQANMIKSAVVQCTLEFPGGGGDMDASGSIDSSDNPNNPYPLNPSDALNLKADPGGCTTTGNATGCIPKAANDQVKNLQCIGAPAGQAAMFTGASNQGRYLPPPPSNFTDWVYVNDSTGVYIKTTGNGDAASVSALTRLLAKFTSTQASVSGNTITIWILNNT